MRSDLISKMTTVIGDLIFDSKKTLFEILDSLDVPQVSALLDETNIRLDEVNDQLRQLGAIVDSNQANNNASFIAVNTQLDALNAEVVALNLAIAPISAQVVSLEQEVATLSAAVLPLETLVSDLENQVNALGDQVTSLTFLVNSYNGRITALETSVTSLSQTVASLTQTVNSLTSRVTTIELTADQNQKLRLGNEYIFTYRIGGVPGTTYFYRINYSGSTSTGINAAIGYSANVLSSESGTSTQRTVYLAAPFDLFSVNNRYNYPMIQGPCRLSFTVNNTNPTEGYITTL